MRSACGHHDAAVSPVFHAELPAAVVSVTRVAFDFVAAPERPLLAADAAAPLQPPPESFVVRSI